jgi:hypothetical protein
LKRWRSNVSAGGLTAQAMLETLIGSGVSFAYKAEAEKLLQQLKHG